MITSVGLIEHETISCLGVCDMGLLRNCCPLIILALFDTHASNGALRHVAAIAAGE
jgi:hypothetical protein